jgi:ribosomal subunit interface protein
LLEKAMDIRVSGHQLDTGEALRERVGTRLTAVADKYASRLVSAQVTFGKGPHDHGFTCEIVAYAPQGVVLKAADRAAAAPAAFEAAADKVEKQLRRHSRRLKDHHPERAAELADVDGFAYRRGGESQGD